MPPRKNKKRVVATSKSTSEDVDSTKKSLKRLKKTAKPSVSTPEKEAVEDENGSDAEEPVPTPKARKPCTWLKLDRLDSQNGNKSSPKSSEQDKEAKRTAHARHPKDIKRKRNEEAEEKSHDRQASNNEQTVRREKKDKEIINEELSKSKIGKGLVTESKEASRDEEKNDDESENELGGLIFMCNAKTKPDCFKYKVMGLPAHNIEIVSSIKPGLKFFLYDYELKVMYGVFEASSAGGMKLEPAAFRGKFPAQVRFVVIKDSRPLRESAFKKAIEENYDEKTSKFKTELTVKQVTKLMKLFKPIPTRSSHPTGHHVFREPTMASEEILMRHSYLSSRYGNNDSLGKFISLHHENQFADSPAFHGTLRPRSPLFLTEQEYRSRGLQHGRHLLPATAVDDASYPWELDIQPKHLLRNPVSTSIDSALYPREVSRADPSFLSEKDYRTYGLRGAHHVPDIRTNAYEESTASLVNRYLALPITTAESYPYHTNAVHSPPPARAIPDDDRALAPYSFRDQSQSVFNQRPPESSRGREIDSISAPVSHRYSFAGPSLSHLR